jgi:3-oxoacyl-[acyl-carrier protein] reductase
MGSAQYAVRYCEGLDQEPSMDTVITSRLMGKVALVTGGARGIGAAIAAKLARDGAKVVINYRANAEAAGRTVQEIISAGGEAFAVQADVSQVSATALLVEAALQKFGGLDILVNNAALLRAGPVDALVEADFDEQFATNVKSVLFLSQAASRAFGCSGGAIVNISSINGRFPSSNAAIYSATKAAVEALTVALARESGLRGIRVNAVAPGATATEMLLANNPPEHLQAMTNRSALGRLGQPDDIADVVAFLVSDEARWITGETITVSGGLRP